MHGFLRAIADFVRRVFRGGRPKAPANPAEAFDEFFGR